MDDLGLSVREFPEQLTIFFRRDVTVNLYRPFALEIGLDELSEIHLKVVAHKAQRGLIIPYHQVGVLSHNMNLLYFLAVILIQHPVILRLITAAVVLDQPFEFHAVVEHQKAAFETQRARFGQI